jgi:2-oxoglutarate ferredoxin oxidoreductase subunit delta
MPTITIFRQTCKGVEDCGICTFVCSKRVFRVSKKMNEAGYLPPEIKDEALCTGCQNCMISCPDFAIVVEKHGDENEQ